MPLADPSLRCTATIVIRCWDDESMTIEGPLQDPRWVLQALDHARDTIRAKITPDAPLALRIPGKDVSL